MGRIVGHVARRGDVEGGGGRALCGKPVSKVRTRPSILGCAKCLVALKVIANDAEDELSDANRRLDRIAREVSR